MSTELIQKKARLGLRLGGVWMIAAILLLLCAGLYLGKPPPAGLTVALLLLAWDISLGSLIVQRALRPLPPKELRSGAPISVLIAAFNEASMIAATLTSVLKQSGVDFEVLVGDDGSSDGTSAAVERAFPSEARVRNFRFDHQGKAATLNQLLARAIHPLIVTLDADTELQPQALSALAQEFEEPVVHASAGSVLIRRPDNWLTHFQFTEYLRNNFVRAAWAQLGALEQVPGACAGFRAESLRAVGGFPTNSITEDYEVVYRLYAWAADSGAPMEVRFVPEAVAETDCPAHLAGFAAQRIRWFAGFMVTLFRFRRLIFNRRAKTFGLIKLPLKVIDAIIPLTSLFFLGVVLFTGLSPDPRLRLFSWLLFAARWLWDAGCYALLIRQAERTGMAPSKGKRRAWVWACALGEALSYAWLRYVVVLAAYPKALRRSTDWKPPRNAATAYTR